MVYEVEGQMSIFDLVDFSFGRTSTEPSVQTEERTSEWYLKKSAGSKTPMPMCLDLRANGRKPDSSWATGIPLVGGSTTHSTTEYRSADGDYVYLLTSMGIQREEFYLNCGEKPLVENSSKLSDILERTPDPKYNLSPKACQGILNRAQRRGKELPKMLRDALEKQAQLLSKNEPESPEEEKDS